MFAARSEFGKQFRDAGLKFLRIAGAVDLEQQERVGAV